MAILVAVFLHLPLLELVAFIRVMIKSWRMRDSASCRERPRLFDKLIDNLPTRRDGLAGSSPNAPETDVVFSSRSQGIEFEGTPALMPIPSPSRNKNWTPRSSNRLFTSRSVRGWADDVSCSSLAIVCLVRPALAATSSWLRESQTRAARNCAALTIGPLTIFG